MMATVEKCVVAKRNEASVLLENIVSIWLISAADNINQTQTDAREFANARFYTDSRQCLDYIKAIVDEHVVIVVSHDHAEKIICSVHLRPTVSAFFIFDPNRQGQLSAKVLNDSKLIGIFTDNESLYASIRSTMHDAERQTLAFNLFSNENQRSTRELSKESASFIWYQLLIDVLKQMLPSEQAKHEMLVKCADYYQNDKIELDNIELFRTTYTHNQAIRFFTNETFLYKLVNKALRTENIELLYAFRFYIIDLCSELEREGAKMIDKGVQTLYRGQRIRLKELETLKVNVGMLISTNGFMSTSRSKDVALRFARNACRSNDSYSILYQIHVDASQLETVPFADITSMSSMPKEDEILFNLEAVFRIDKVEIYDESLKMWTVYMTVTDDGKRSLKDYLKMQRSIMDEYTPAIFFGRLLWNELGQLDQATAYFQLLLKSEHDDTASVLNNLGIVQALKGDFAVALVNCERALEIRSKKLPKDHPHIATSLHNIGLISSLRGDPVRAIDNYERALAIREKAYPDDNANKASTLANLGVVFKMQRDYVRARDFVQRAFEMRQRILPESHPQIAACLWHLGGIAEAESDYSTAISFYKRAFDIDELALSAEHVELSKDLNILVRVYKTLGDTKQAIDLCKKQLVKQESVLNTNKHPRISRTLMTIGDIFEEDVEQRVVYYKQALEADPTSIDCLKRLGACAYSREEFTESLVYWEHALDIALRSYSSTHPDIAQTYLFIGNAHYEMKTYAEALKAYNESLKIWEANSDDAQRKDVQKCIFKTQVRLELILRENGLSGEVRTTNVTTHKKTVTCNVQ